MTRVLRNAAFRSTLGRTAAARLACVLIAALFFVTGCGQSALDGSRLESEIDAQLLPQYPGAIRSVSCPDTVDPQPGQQILCVASIGGQVLDVDVVVGGTEGALTTTATVTARFVAVDEVAALLAATFGDEVGIVTGVDCGEPVMVLDVDEAVRCEATDPAGVTRIFDVTIDDDGLVELTLR